MIVVTSGIFEDSWLTHANTLIYTLCLMEQKSCQSLHWKFLFFLEQSCIIFSLDLPSILKINIPSKGNALEEIQAREELNSLNFFSDREDWMLLWKHLGRKSGDPPIKNPLVYAKVNQLILQDIVDIHALLDLTSDERIFFC